MAVTTERTALNHPKPGTPVRAAKPVAAAVPSVRRAPRQAVDAFVHSLAEATPLQRVDIEREGVPGAFLKELSVRLAVPATRIYDMLGVPKATAEKKAADGGIVSGSGGQAAIGIARLLGIAQRLVANSTAAEAKDFDAAKWLGLWLERPQPSLGGRKPGDLVDTPTGLTIVARLLGAIEGGAYQ